MKEQVRIEFNNLYRLGSNSIWGGDVATGVALVSSSLCSR